MQLGAFMVIVLMRRQNAIGDELKDLSGLYQRRPVAAFAMLLFMLSLGGIPPTAGFMGKFWLFGAAIESGYVWLAVIGVLNSAISLYYYLRIVVFMYLKKDATVAADAGHQPVAGVRDGRRGGRHHLPGRVSAAALRAGRGVGAHAGRDGAAHRDSVNRSSVWSSADFRSAVRQA